MINPNKLDELIFNIHCKNCPLENICNNFKDLSCKEMLFMWLNDELPEWCSDGCADEDLELVNVVVEEDGDSFTKSYDYKCRKCERHWRKTELFRLAGVEAEALDD